MDGGSTWRTVNTPVMRTWHAVCMTPGGLRGWVVGQYGAVMRTTDGGVTWTVQRSGTHKDLYGLFCDADGRYAKRKTRIR